MDKMIVMKIIQIINANIDGNELKDEQIDTNLVELGVSSIEFIRIVVALEEEFSCQIPDSKLLLLEMNTVSKIYQVIIQSIK